MDVKGQWGRLYNYGLGPAINTKISFISYRVCIGKDVFVIDESKQKDFPYRLRYNVVPAHPSHIAVGEQGTFVRLPTPIVVDYNRLIDRLDCIVKIECEDLYTNKHVRFQGLRIFTDHLSDTSNPRILFTFLEEVDPKNPDFSVFGPPDSHVPNFADLAE